MQKMAFEKSWRPSKGGDDEQSQVFAICCAHVYTRTHMFPNLVTETSHT